MKSVNLNESQQTPFQANESPINKPEPIPAILEFKDKGDVKMTDEKIAKAFDELIKDMNLGDFLSDKDKKKISEADAKFSAVHSKPHDNKKVVKPITERDYGTFDSSKMRLADKPTPGVPSAPRVQTNAPGRAYNISERDAMKQDDEDFYRQFVREDGTLDYDAYARAMEGKINTAQDVTERAQTRVGEAGPLTVDTDVTKLKEAGEQIIEPDLERAREQQYDTHHEANIITPGKFLERVGGKSATKLLSLTKPQYVTAVGIASALDDVTIHPGEPNTLKFMDDETGEQMEVDISITEAGNFKISFPFQDKIKGRNARVSKKNDIIIPAKAGANGKLVPNMDKIQKFMDYYETEFVQKTNEEHEGTREYSDILDQISNNVDALRAGKVPKVHLAKRGL